LKVLGKFNEIHSDDIGEGTVIANFCYIGRNVSIGKNCKIHNYCAINDGTVIGDNCLFNDYCLFNSDTIIGSNVMFGANVMTADEKAMSIKTNEIKRVPCKIESYCKIGQGARLISANIGMYSIVGAASLVLKDIPSRQVWAGVPAKYIRNVSAFEMSL